MSNWTRNLFKIPGDDGRPMTFPPPGPFWITGSNDTHVTVVAYLPIGSEVTDQALWPDAEDIDAEVKDTIQYTDRFRKPEWWKGE